MLVGDGPLGQSASGAPRRLTERPTKLRRECHVVVAAAPPEVVGRREVTWGRCAAAAYARAGTARLGDGVRERRSAQRVDERLLTAPCNPPPPSVYNSRRYSVST